MTQPHHFAISVDHPVLAGHFPGNPIVPASMILEQVIAAWGRPCQGVRSAKFLRPLRGGRQVQIAFEVGTNGNTIHFSCLCANKLICTGEFIAGQVK